MDLPFYTLAQAARKIDCHTDELEFLIEQKKLPVYLYSNFRKFVLLRDKTGIAIVTFHGILKPKNIQIEEFYRRGELFVDQPIHLIGFENIKSWEISLPIDQDVYFQEADVFFNKWDGIEQSLFECTDQVLAVPFVGLAHENFQIRHREERKTQPNLPLYCYEYHKNESFSDYDFRLLHQDLLNLENNSSKELNDSLPVDINGSANRVRQNEFHNLLRKIIKAKGAIKAQDVWRLLREDASKAVRVYDIDMILQEVTHEKIIWKSIGESIRTFQKSSLPPLLSKLKREAVN